MSRNDSHSNLGSASDLLTTFSLFRTACLPPRRTTTAPLESISSSDSFSLEVRLALGKGVSMAGRRLKPAPCTAPVCRGAHRACPVHRQPRCRKEPQGPLLLPFPADLDNSRGKDLKEKWRWLFQHPNQVPLSDRHLLVLQRGFQGH